MHELDETTWFVSWDGGSSIEGPFDTKLAAMTWARAQGPSKYAMLKRHTQFVEEVRNPEFCPHDGYWTRIVTGIANQTSTGHFDGEDWIGQDDDRYEMDDHIQVVFVCAKCDTEMSYPEAIGRADNEYPEGVDPGAG
jgi:hypothetical protein